MKDIKIIRSFYFTFLCLGGFLAGGFQAAAQETPISPENPPIPVKVELRNAQGLNFGAFTVGPAGGKVFIYTDGSRHRQDDIILLNNGIGQSPSFAIFDVYTNPGTLLQIQPPVDVTLSGPYNNSLTLTIDPLRDISTLPAPVMGQSFITTQNPHPIIIGGTLNVPPGSGDFPGSYSGTFVISIIHE